jgi:hypothetical protein
MATHSRRRFIIGTVLILVLTCAGLSRATCIPTDLATPAPQDPVARVLAQLTVCPRNAIELVKLTPDSAVQAVFADLVDAGELSDLVDERLATADISVRRQHDDAALLNPRSRLPDTPGRADADHAWLTPAQSDIVAVDALIEQRTIDKNPGRVVFPSTQPPAAAGRLMLTPECQVR